MIRLNNTFANTLFLNMIAVNDFNRSLSRVFSNPEFKKIARSGSNEYLLTKLKKYDNILSLEPGMKVKNILENAYSYLGKNYRNEYVYKNTILNNILLGRHSLKTATMLNEFRVGNSIADTLIINGTSTVYEIKTELDTIDKLEKQLSDYRKVCGRIFLVTHHSLGEKYFSLVKNSKIGLMSLSSKFNLSVIKDADVDYSGLCKITLMKTLRKDEYTSLIENYYGELPEVPNIRFFSACLSMAKKMDVNTLHDFVMFELKKRRPIESELLVHSDIPKEIKHICHAINPNKKEYLNLINFLTLNL